MGYSALTTQTVNTAQQRDESARRKRPVVFREEAPNNTFPVEIAFRCSDEDMHRAFELARSKMAAAKENQ